MTPTEILEREHHFIQQVAAVMVVIAQDLEQGEQVSPEALRDIVEFLRTYADRCHHGKEETLLFPLLEQKGVPPRGCPLGALKGEHETGRALVSQVSEAVDNYSKDSSAREPLKTSLSQLVELYKGHIWKEDYLLFPMMNKMLSDAEQNGLSQQFNAVDAALGPETPSRFEESAAKLQRQVMRD